MNLLKNARSIAYANTKEYDVIYFIGDHDVMFDFPDNQYIQDAINEIYNHGSTVASFSWYYYIVKRKNEKGRYFIDNKVLTSFSNRVEVLVNRKNLVHLYWKAN